VIGFVRLASGGVQAAKLGYMIAADHWGNGYATDAARTVLRFAFGPLALHRVTAAIGPENSASIAVVKNLGFSYEGHLRHHVFTNGAWRDSVLFSLLSTETAALIPR
jgi:ribosomal-protein-alanine N-acetyltransferase